MVDAIVRGGGFPGDPVRRIRPRGRPKQRQGDENRPSTGFCRMRYL